MNLFVLLALTAPVSFANQFQGFGASLAKADPVTLSQVDQDRIKKTAIQNRFETLLRFEPQRLSNPLRLMMIVGKDPSAEQIEDGLDRPAVRNEVAAVVLLDLVRLEARLATRFDLDFAEVGRETELLVELGTLNLRHADDAAFRDLLGHFPAARGTAFLRAYVEELKHTASKKRPNTALKRLAGHFGRAITRASQRSGRHEATRAWVQRPVPREVAGVPRIGSTAALAVAHRYLCGLALERELPEDFVFALSTLANSNKSDR